MSRKEGKKMRLTERTRWIIRRKDTDEIMCGLARQFHFKTVEKIGDTAIKTYRSKKQALSAFEKSLGHVKFEVEAVKVVESMEIVEE